MLEASAAGLIGFGSPDDSMERFMYRKVFTSKVFDRKVVVITGGNTVCCHIRANRVTSLCASVLKAIQLRLRLFIVQPRSGFWLGFQPDP